MAQIRSVAIIGAGPAGVISVDALSQECAFETIRVFERRERAGGCWIDDPKSKIQKLPNFETLAERTPDSTLEVPSSLPIVKPHDSQYRFEETSMYPTLETNIDADAMAFIGKPFPSERSALNIKRHGPNSPFRHYTTIEKYLRGLLKQDGYEDLVCYNTTVELIQKNQSTRQWEITLRKPLDNGIEDRWWTESFDAVLVASGHYTVPYIPHTPGLADFAKHYPGSIEHSKAWRSTEKYVGKRVVVVGSSISGADIAFTLADHVKAPLHAVNRKNYHPYFGDHSFRHPLILEHPFISHVISDPETDERTVYFQDGTKVEKVDHIIFGTGYTWTLPFLPEIAATIRNNRVPNLYQHIFYNQDPTLCFVGAVAAGFTFKVFEWQAVLAARYLAGRVNLPSPSDQMRWEEERIAEKGDGVKFTALYPHFEEYFEELRKMAGEPETGKGITLPKWDKQWQDDFDRGHEFRIRMWKRGNEEARERLRKEEQKMNMDGAQNLVKHFEAVFPKGLVQSF